MELHASGSRKVVVCILSLIDVLNLLNIETFIDEVEHEVDHREESPCYKHNLDFPLHVQLIPDVSYQPVKHSKAKDLCPTEEDEAHVVQDIHGAVLIHIVEGSFREVSPASDWLIDWNQGVDPGEDEGEKGEDEERNEDVQEELEH